MRWGGGGNGEEATAWETAKSHSWFHHPTPKEHPSFLLPLSPFPPASPPPLQSRGKPGFSWPKFEFTRVLKDTLVENQLSSHPIPLRGISYLQCSLICNLSWGGDTSQISVPCAYRWTFHEKYGAGAQRFPLCRAVIQHQPEHHREALPFELPRRSLGFLQ